jgi:hypothetical protein
MLQLGNDVGEALNLGIFGCERPLEQKVVTPQA